MARVAAHDVHHTTAADDLALVANALDAGFDFHRSIPNSAMQWR
jgi:hypothetical protein